MHELPDNISRQVRAALKEDVGSGDLTSKLIRKNTRASALVIAREDAVLCGSAWFDEVFKQLKSPVESKWQAKDGETIKQDQLVCELEGPARALLTGERTALNFLQTLSGTATVTREYVTLLTGLKTKLLDTRKTLPGLRAAQKYAVLCGGGENHRMGLYDAILIKENHIAATGSIAEAIKQAKKTSVAVEVEVEFLHQLEEALEAGADRILLDNFNTPKLVKAVALNRGRAKLEASGNIHLKNLRSVAETGVDYISTGALTKHLHAIDFSMRIRME
ncbi:MAG: carboxylating nicotinate-nucleotide diphosphorylase [Gammaproteobacteria bacterium]|nr:carboxylating nicotinate-nucleotide diphosphorylase [Gammaproteobacteria bacterium]NIN62228.1 carboxylating nicotinate-nucleotide diphosphorylase [Gammaproteobacteria bacterium]NIO62239.1 carboxylating nicotinate-nucleotide diphosphorylase [Gammaproteobacteria bacterium]NIP48759.1 carboxylating nicotinate-nucleotide diphosphorylase [Gammaproteobacteria bacterium]NIQ09213.1 carboxylating nicotinate-nucleotide diphosphorylase [Gammaproteobacteria bacterium]